MGKYIEAFPSLHAIYNSHGLLWARSAHIKSQYRKGASLTVNWTLIAIVLAAGFVQGVTGFGFGLVAMGALVLLMAVDEAVVLVTIISLCSVVLNLWTVRQQVLWRETWPILLTAVPAVVLGVYLLRVLDMGRLRVGVGIMILFGCAVTLLTPNRVRIDRAFPWGHLAGLVGGLFGGALGTGGPPVVLYTLFRGWDKAVAKGLISAYFVVTGAWRLALLAATGVATGERVQQGLVALLPALVAAYAGTRVFSRMSSQTFRYAVTLLLSGLAVRLIWMS